SFARIRTRWSFPHCRRLQLRHKRAALACQGQSINCGARRNEVTPKKSQKSESRRFRERHCLGNKLLYLPVRRIHARRDARMPASASTGSEAPPQGLRSAEIPGPESRTLGREAGVHAGDLAGQLRYRRFSGPMHNRSATCSWRSRPANIEDRPTKRLHIHSSGHTGGETGTISGPPCLRSEQNARDSEGCEKSC